MSFRTPQQLISMINTLHGHFRTNLVSFQFAN